jgi:ABC-type polysaccharide/polyol phosphate export permease
MKLIFNHQLYYLRESWNVLEMMTLILVMISVGLFHSGKENQGSFRALNVLVGGLIWFVIVTGSLRSTFLPFSVFVSGFTMVRHCDKSNLHWCSTDLIDSFIPYLTSAAHCLNIS